MGAIVVAMSVVVWVVVCLWAVVRPAWARLPNRASTVGVWILPVVLFIIGAALIPDDETSLEVSSPAMTEIAAEATGGSGQAQAGPGEWRIDDALVDTSPKMQIASLTATDGDLVLGVFCTDDIVDQVAIGFGNDPPSIWVHDYLYLSVDGGAIHSNWSQIRTGDSGLPEPWRGYDHELESLDGPQLLERLARSTRLVIEARRLPDHPIISATFDGSGLAATLARMACRIPSTTGLSSFESERQSQDAGDRTRLLNQIDRLGTTSATPWHREGTGAMILDKPAAVRRVRITAQYDGWTQNFVVICGEALTVLEFLGTDERSVHYEGTHRMDCSEVEIPEATGVRWSFTEVP